MSAEEYMEADHFIIFLQCIILLFLENIKKNLQTYRSKNILENFFRK